MTQQQVAYALGTPMMPDPFGNTGSMFSVRSRATTRK